MTRRRGRMRRAFPNRSIAFHWDTGLCHPRVLAPLRPPQLQRVDLRGPGPVASSPAAVGAVGAAERGARGGAGWGGVCLSVCGEFAGDAPNTVTHTETRRCPLTHLPAPNICGRDGAGLRARETGGRCIVLGCLPVHYLHLMGDPLLSVRRAVPFTPEGSALDSLVFTVMTMYYSAHEGHRADLNHTEREPTPHSNRQW